MSSATAIRLQIETALADRIPSALTPSPHFVRPTAPTGIGEVDELLDGGLPIGALTEVIGSECAGKTSLALSFLAQLTQSGKVCAWIDVSDRLTPASAAGAGVHLSHLLWIRCGVQRTANPIGEAQITFRLPGQCLAAPAARKGLHGGGHGTHPRQESKGVADAIGELLQGKALGPRCMELQHSEYREPQKSGPKNISSLGRNERTVSPDKPWSRLDQALRVTDLLLQGGGFSAIVLDMGSVAPSYAARIPVPTWFRYRAAAERTQSSVLLLTQYPCAKSSAGLVLQLEGGKPLRDETTVFTGCEQHLAVHRQRFTDRSTVVPLKKPARTVHGAAWQSRSAWVGRR